MMTATSLNTKIKSLLEATFMHIMVEGEVASVTYHSSGHLYFSIKDDKSSVRCVMWRSSVSKLKFSLKKGERIVIDGSIGVYTPRGEYQFMATHIEPYGKGALAVAFEQLKEKLEKKGYFDLTRKILIPKFPRKIAIITAANSAALQDMLKVSRKRWDAVELTVIDVLVQGDLAAAEIANGIRYADTLEVDIIIVSRGGGSSEDLWAFNEEIVADAIFTATTAVVSAVGHEVDTMISDFVADLRAPTPSAAMEMVLPDKSEMLYMTEDRLEQLIHRMRYILSSKEGENSRLLEELFRSSIPYKLQNMQKEFDLLHHDMSSALEYKLGQFEALLSPLYSRTKESIDFILLNKNKELEMLLNRSYALNPSKQIHEAWAQVTVAGKKSSLNDIKVGNEFELMSEKVKVKVKALEKSKI